MKNRKYAKVLAMLGVVILFSNENVYAKTPVQSNSQNTATQKSDNQNDDTNDSKSTEDRLYAGVAGVFEAVLSTGNIQNATDIVTISQPKVAASDSIESDEEEDAYWGYTNLGIAHVDNHLNIRKEPSENAKLVGKLTKDAACEILSIEDGWASIRSGKVEGYCKLEYLYTGDEAIKRGKEVASLIAVVNTETLKVREQPNTECAVITLIPREEELEVAEIMENGWVKFLLDDEEAYVSGEFVDIEERLEKAVTLTEIMYGQGVSDVRVSLVQYAKQFIGNPYVWGGTSLTNGADCSGFTMSIMKKYGISLPHHAASQAQMGTKISLAEAQPGDLVFYAKNGSINHVAIYIGNGQVVHASNPKSGIKISNVNYRTPIAVRRYLS